MTRFEELGWRDSPMGEISLRRRFDPEVQAEVYEVKLDEDFLMSSLFTVAERELSHLGLARVTGDDLEVVVGGLGLGYTALAALEDPRVRDLMVIEYSDAVIDWHERDLLPDTVGLAADERVRLACADFFAAAMSDEGFDPERPGRAFDAVLLDIDHSPSRVLHSPHAEFYTPAGLRAMAAHLKPEGVFAIWSDDPPEPEFMTVLMEVFKGVNAKRVWFDNPYTGGRSSNTVYTAVKV
ncbi:MULTISPECIES: spermidine synthase [Glycomyces]|uniref:Spermidine synthase n=2 Tax=Glycomyces TaxID=58113 RepID=A0A9X3PGD6_9ACTN|nr:spermidine synthase [Glycomyces lechevalierae]MDA1384432.1 spermidine synthase [Glycomyces lechevalierae]MDR7338071.1 spermidine synthase [Glycomyces lechevalierae]